MINKKRIENNKMASECKYCNSKWKSEEKCREIFERLFPNYKFKKSRPGFLEKLELDGYCSKLSLAFEFDGIQHTKHVQWFHKTKKQFEEQKKRDKRKNRLCRENDVKLIRIPYDYEKTNDTLEMYIIKSLAANGFRFEVIFEPRYIAILSESQGEKNKGAGGEGGANGASEEEKKQMMRTIYTLLEFTSENSSYRTTKEKVLKNKVFWDDNLSIIRKTFGLTSQTKPTTIQGYLSFLNSIFRTANRSLVAISNGVYELQAKQAKKENKKVVS